MIYCFCKLNIYVIPFNYILNEIISNYKDSINSEYDEYHVKLYCIIISSQIIVCCLIYNIDPIMFKLSKPICIYYITYL